MHDAQQVASQDLAHGFGRVAALEQAARQIGELAHVVHLLWHAPDSVPIGSQSHVIGTRHADCVVEMVEQNRERGARGGMRGRLRPIRRAPGAGVVGIPLADLLVHVLPARVVLARLAGSFFVDVGRVEVHHQDAPVLRQSAQHVVVEVAPVIRHRSHGRVRGNHRGLRNRDYVPERLIGDMRDVDHHAQSVHLANHPLAKGREPVVPGRQVAARPRRVGPGGVERVGERHVPHSQAVEAPQCGEIVLDDVAALDTHHTGELALGHGGPDLRDAARHRDIFGIAIRHLVDGVDALERLANRRPVALPLTPLTHVDRPELHVEATLADAGQVHVSLCVALVEVPVRVLEERCRI